MAKLSGKLSFVKESRGARARAKRAFPPSSLPKSETPLSISLSLTLSNLMDRKHDPKPLDYRHRRRRRRRTTSLAGLTSVKYSLLHLDPSSIYFFSSSSSSSIYAYHFGLVRISDSKRE